MSSPGKSIKTESSHGGKRVGAGARRASALPAVSGAGIPWKAIRELAECGSPAPEIMAAFELNPANWSPEDRNRLGAEILRGRAVLRAMAKRALVKLATGRLQGASVTALVALLERLGDNKGNPCGEFVQTHGGSAIAKIQTMLDDLAKRRPKCKECGAPLPAEAPAA